MKHIIPILTAGVLLTNASFALAADPEATHLATIQARGVTDITARTTAISGLVNEVASAKKLSDTQKSTLTAELKTESIALQTLGAALAADTTVATAKTDFQRIFTEHYIFALYLPKMKRITSTDSELDAAAKITSLVPKLEDYISKANDKKVDVTTMTTTLTEAQSKITEATTLATTASATLLTITPADYPANKTTLEGTRANIKTARADLEVARKDIRSLETMLKAVLTSVE